MSHDDFQPPDAPTSEQEHEARELLSSNPQVTQEYAPGLWRPAVPAVCDCWRCRLSDFWMLLRWLYYKGTRW